MSTGLPPSQPRAADVQATALATEEHAHRLSVFLLIGAAAAFTFAVFYAGLGRLPVAILCVGLGAAFLAIRIWALGNGALLISMFVTALMMGLIDRNTVQAKAAWRRS